MDRPGWAPGEGMEKRRVNGDGVERGNAGVNIFPLSFD
jgi:hypothetical protein